MKKIISFSAAAVLAVSCIIPAYAEGADSTSMTVQEAVDYALEHSLTIAKCKADVYGKKYEMAQAKINQNQLKDNGYLEVSSIETGLALKGYAYEATKLSYEVAQRSMEDNKKTIEVQVKNDFYTYLDSVSSTELAKQNLESAQTRLASAEMKLKSGAISELDCKNFELSVKSAQNALNSAQRDMEVKLITLKNTMNYPADKELVPVGRLEFEYGELMTAEEAIKKSRSESTYLNIADSLELAKKRWQISSGFYIGTQNEYKSEKATYESAVADFTQNVNNLDLGIRQMYNGLLTLKENVECAEFSLEIQKSNAEAAYLKYEMGLVTANDYRETEQSYIKAQNELQELKLSYITTKLKYDNMLLSAN
ncbi:MAG: TolC family protein [Clostridia bacterium]|nr:TolC family protein [Clostridia bacterium]